MKKAVYPIITAIAFFFAATNTVSYVKTKAAQKNLFQKPSPTLPRRIPQGYEGRLSAAAKVCGIQHLQSIGTDDSSTAVRMELESDLRSTIRFINALNSPGNECLKLSITPAVDNRSVRTDLLVGLVSLPDDKQAAIYSGPSVRFEGPHRQQTTPTIAAAKQDDSKLRAEQERQEKERMAREESQRIQTKKNELETGLTLNGIVNNGRETMAIVNVRNGGQTLMLKNGDTLQEARVMSIDEKSGEMRLDYQGKLQVSLKLP